MDGFLYVSNNTRTWKLLKKFDPQPVTLVNTFKRGAHRRSNESSTLKELDEGELDEGEHSSTRLRRKHVKLDKKKQNSMLFISHILTMFLTTKLNQFTLE